MSVAIHARTLGLIERLFVECARLNAFLMARTVLLDGRIEPDVLRTALAEVQRTTPMLRSRIAAQRLEIVAPDEAPPPVVHVLPRADDDAWRTAARNEVHRPFDEAGPLWRTTLVHDPKCDRCELVIGLHHTICDGAGAHALVALILRAVAAAEEGRLASEFVDRSPDRPPPDAVDDRLPWRTPRWLTAARQLGGALLPSFRRATSIPVDRPGAALAERRTSAWFGVLDDAATQRVADRAKNAGATVNGILCASLIRALRPFAAHPDRDFLLQSTIDLRGVCVPTLPRDELGVCMSAVTTRHHAGDARSFDDLARECTRAVKEARGPHCWPTYRFLGAMVAPFARSAAHGSGQGRGPTLGVSNLGRVDVPRSVGRFTLRGMQSLTGQHVLGGNVFLIAGTIHGRLHLSLASADTVLSDLRLAQLGARLTAELDPSPPDA